eukprot:CAMPEP_0175711630 /NCGR_PEP_ID=MMETSP0097-20121207/40688_1 /TAXON_ID=311494 /ORGANISM="Alexandrium monilatum, Strain CCMP3105" /LENGTH=359 /DNA_ID=CAMNT_0017019069 /DNA_START=86 /DNA_END=1166 /DNA_ORIENTATION=-
MPAPGGKEAQAHLSKQDHPAHHNAEECQTATMRNSQEKRAAEAAAAVNTAPLDAAVLLARACDWTGERANARRGSGSKARMRVRAWPSSRDAHEELRQVLAQRERRGRGGRQCAQRRSGAAPQRLARGGLLAPRTGAALRSADGAVPGRVGRAVAAERLLQEAEPSEVGVAPAVPARRRAPDAAAHSASGAVPRSTDGTVLLRVGWAIASERLMHETEPSVVGVGPTTQALVVVVKNWQAASAAHLAWHSDALAGLHELSVLDAGSAFQATNVAKPAASPKTLITPASPHASASTAVPLPLGPLPATAASADGTGRKHGVAGNSHCWLHQDHHQHTQGHVVPFGALAAMYEVDPLLPPA